MEEKPTPVFAVEVKNISPNANEKTVSDFFSFCGKITKLYLDKEEGKETSRAVVEFGTESAAKTALLLTNALIVDRPILVTPYPPKDVEKKLEQITPPGTPVPSENITQRDFGGAEDEERSKTSVVASMIASGYVLASDALNKAKQYDDEHNITLQLKVGMEQLKVKAHEVDQTYGISEKAASVKHSAEEKAKKLNEDYKITEKASAAAEKVKSTAGAVAAKAQENPTVVQAVGTVKSGWQTVANSVSGFYQEFQEQTAKAIEEKKKERAAKNAEAQPTVQPQVPQETGLVPEPENQPQDL